MSETPVTPPEAVHPAESALDRALAKVGATVKVVDGERVELTPPATVSAVPEAARSRLTDRLKKREVKKAIAVLPPDDPNDEPTLILVTGLESGQMDELREMARDDEEDESDKVNVSRSQARMFMAMCTDPETGEKAFEGWEEDDFKHFPLADASIILRAIGQVNGQTSEPGKGSPSTADADSSSKSHSE